MIKFWGPGNHQLFVLSARQPAKDGYMDATEVERNGLFTLPFAKSAITSFHNAVSALKWRFGMTLAH